MYAQTRPRFMLSSEGVLGGMEFEPMLTPREKSSLPKISPEEDRTRDAVDSEPKHYQLSYSGPLICFVSPFFLHWCLFTCLLFCLHVCLFGWLAGWLADWLVSCILVLALWFQARVCVLGEGKRHRCTHSSPQVVVCREICFLGSVTSH